MRCPLESWFQKDLRFFEYSGARLVTRAEEERKWQSDMANAISQHFNCTKMLKGRFWVAHMHFVENFTDVSGETFRDYLGNIAHGVRAMGMCAPVDCSLLRVRDLLVPMAWWVRFFASTRHLDVAQAAHRVFSNMIKNPSRPHIGVQRMDLPVLRRAIRVEVEELATWANIDLSWAILGFPGTGTTTLATHLHTHPELEVVYEEKQRAVMEEHFFLYGRTAYLPPLNDVSLFNSKRTKPIIEEASTRRLRGVKRSSYILSPSAVARLARVPRLVALVVIRDPVFFAEKEYLRRATCCLETNPHYEIPPLESCVGQACSLPCGVEPFCGAEYLPIGCGGDPCFTLDRETISMARHLRKAVALFGKARIRVVDTTDLTSDPNFYNAVAAFIGTTLPFPTDASLDTRLNEKRFTKDSIDRLRQMIIASSGEDAYASGLVVLRNAMADERMALRALISGLIPLVPGGNGLPKWFAELE